MTIEELFESSEWQAACPKIERREGVKFPLPTHHFDQLGPVVSSFGAYYDNPPEDPHKYCRGGGGNNFHCGCKYDA
jgi:hypothetical protein